MAFLGRPRFLFSPIFISLAAGGGLQYFSRIASPITCLQINSLKNAGQLQEPFLQRDGLLGKITFQMFNDSL